ncbi:MAG: hypothetical protein HFE83_08035 [Lachnospiraceae bacterium]|nr:hypothetical protein [Lachnospiraceae bacterium]
MKLKRDFPGVFDVAKGVLILLIILAHQKSVFLSAFQIDSPFLSAKSFGGSYDAVVMGLFFMMAGYTSHIEKDRKAYIKKSARALLIPYFLTMAALVVLKIFQYLCLGGLTIQAVSPFLAGFLYGNGIPGVKLFGTWEAESVGAAWFLPALFWSGVIHQMLLRIQKPVTREALIWCLSAAAAALPDAHTIQVPWFLIPGCVAVGFREAGRLLKAHKVLYKEINWPFAAAAVILTIMLHHVSDVKFWSNIWQFWMLDYLSAVAIGTVLLQWYIRSGLAVAGFADGLSYIGRYSLFFFCLHNVEMLLFPWYKIYMHIFVPSHIPWEAAFLLMYIGRILFAVLGCQFIIWTSGRLRELRRSRE